MLYLPSSKSPAAQTAVKMVAAPGTGTPSKDQRLLTNTWPKTRQQHKHTCKQKDNTKKQYNNT